MTCQESWSSGKKSGQCVVAGTGHGVIPKYVFCVFGSFTAR